MSDENTTVLIVSAVGAVSIFMLSFFLGLKKGQHDVYKEAVKNNVGEWVIQADGKPTFRFKK